MPTQFTSVHVAMIKSAAPAALQRRRMAALSPEPSSETGVKKKLAEVRDRVRHRLRRNAQP